MFIIETERFYCGLCGSGGVVLSVEAVAGVKQMYVPLYVVVGGAGGGGVAHVHINKYYCTCQLLTEISKPRN